MTLCVLDASVALAWAFEDETSAYAEKVIDKIHVHGATVPPIWPLEVTNAMLGAVRRRRFQEAEATRFLEFLNTMKLRPPGFSSFSIPFGLTSIQRSLAANWRGDSSCWACPTD